MHGPFMYAKCGRLQRRWAWSNADKRRGLGKRVFFADISFMGGISYWYDTLAELMLHFRQALPVLWLNWVASR